MMMEQIKYDLTTWFEYVSNKFQWLGINYEFSQERKVWLVSFSPVSRINCSDEFNLEAMAFEDEMNGKYGLDAPLFTDEENLFKLSPLAQTFRLQSIDCSESAILYEKKDTKVDWGSSLFSVSSKKSETFQFFSNHECPFVKVA